MPHQPDHRRFWLHLQPYINTFCPYSTHCVCHNHTVWTERSGERRVSLYDVLTGDAPLPPRGGGSTGPGPNAGVYNGGRNGGGIAPLGGARRASIFDRIADVVFNEEQKEEDPVDAVAVRSVEQTVLTLNEGVCVFFYRYAPGGDTGAGRCSMLLAPCFRPSSSPVQTAACKFSTGSCHDRRC